MSFWHSRNHRVLFIISLILFSCFLLTKVDVWSAFGYSPMLFIRVIENISSISLGSANASSTSIVNSNRTLSNSTNNRTGNDQRVNANDQPREAFVTFSNNQPTYLALLKILLDSVHTFSTRPIIAYGIDVDLNVNVSEYPRVIKRRISQSDCGSVVHRRSSFSIGLIELCVRCF
jgi:hypothetical protein